MAAAARAMAGRYLRRTFIRSHPTMAAESLLHGPCNSNARGNQPKRAPHANNRTSFSARTPFALTGYLQPNHERAAFSRKSGAAAEHPLALGGLTMVVCVGKTRPFAQGAECYPARLNLGPGRDEPSSSPSPNVPKHILLAPWNVSVTNMDGSWVCRRPARRHRPPRRRRAHERLFCRYRVEFLPVAARREGAPRDSRKLPQISGRTSYHQPPSCGGTSPPTRCGQSLTHAR